MLVNCFAAATLFRYNEVLTESEYIDEERYGVDQLEDGN